METLWECVCTTVVIVVERSNYAENAEPHVIRIGAKISGNLYVCSRRYV